jgi:hypothetical protein
MSYKMSSGPTAQLAAWRIRLTHASASLFSVYYLPRLTSGREG